MQGSYLQCYVFLCTNAPILRMETLVGEAAVQPGDARWADEFARDFVQGLNFGSEQELEAAWKEQV